MMQVCPKQEDPVSAELAALYNNLAGCLHQMVREWVDEWTL